MRYAFLFVLATAACSGSAPKKTATNGLMLCAGEALFQARQTGTSPGAENALRERAQVFTSKLPQKQQQDAPAKVDELADHRGARPLAEASDCDALLTGEDRKRLAEVAARERKQQSGLWNSQ